MTGKPLMLTKVHQSAVNHHIFVLVVTGRPEDEYCESERYLATRSDLVALRDQINSLLEEVS